MSGAWVYAAVAAHKRPFALVDDRVSREIADFAHYLLRSPCNTSPGNFEIRALAESRAQ